MCACFSTETDRVAAVRVLRLALAVALMLGMIPALVSAPALGEAATAPVYVNYWHQAPGPTFSGYFVARAHPRTCTIWGTPEDLANENVLRNLRWRSWGRATAMLTGQIRNTHPGMGGPLWTSVTARLSRIRSGCDGDRFYTWLTFPHSQAAPEHLSLSCEPTG